MNLTQEELRQSLEWEIQHIGKHFIFRAAEGEENLIAQYETLIQNVLDEYGVTGDLKTTYRDGILSTQLTLPEDAMYRFPRSLQQFLYENAKTPPTKEADGGKEG